MLKSENKPIDYMNLPYNLKLLRMQSKLDINYIAQYCKVSKRKVLAWEKGIAMPTLWQLECLTVLFKTSMDMICGTKQSSKLIANQAIADNEVTVKELMLVRLYRELNEKTQEILKNLIEKLFLDEIEKNEEMISELNDVLSSNDFEKFYAFLKKYNSQTN